MLLAGPATLPDRPDSDRVAICIYATSVSAWLPVEGVAARCVCAQALVLDNDPAVLGNPPLTEAEVSQLLVEP